MGSKFGFWGVLPIFGNSFLGISTENWYTFSETAQPFRVKKGSEVENDHIWTSTFSSSYDRFSHMGRPNRFRYRQTEVRVSNKVDDGKSIKPEMNDVTEPEVGEIVGRSRRSEVC